MNKLFACKFGWIMNLGWHFPGKLMSNINREFCKTIQMLHSYTTKPFFDTYTTTTFFQSANRWCSVRMLKTTKHKITATYFLTKIKFWRFSHDLKKVPEQHKIKLASDPLFSGVRNMMVFVKLRFSRILAPKSNFDVFHTISKKCKNSIK